MLFIVIFASEDLWITTFYVKYKNLETKAVLFLWLAGHISNAVAMLDSVCMLKEYQMLT